MFKPARLMMMAAMTFGMCAALPATAQLLPSSPALRAPNHFEFDGRWTCAGTFANSAVHRSSYVGRRIFGGAVIQLEEIDLQPTGYKGIYEISYDPYGKRFILMQSTNEGPAAYASNEGWQGNSITFTALPAFVPAMPGHSERTWFRFIYEIDTPSRFEVLWQQHISTVWKTGDHLICNKQKELT